LQRVDPGRAEESAGGEIDRHDSAANDRSNPPGRARQNADDRSARDELRRQDPDAAKHDEARDDCADCGAITELQEVAGRVKAVVLGQPPESWTYPEGERERRDTCRPAPPPGVQALTISEPCDVDGGAGADGSRQHLRHKEPGTETSSGDEKRAARSHKPGGP